MASRPFLSGRLRPWLVQFSDSELGITLIKRMGITVLEMQLINWLCQNGLIAMLSELFNKAFTICSVQWYFIIYKRNRDRCSTGINTWPPAFFIIYMNDIHTVSYKFSFISYADETTHDNMKNKCFQTRVNFQRELILRWSTHLKTCVYLEINSMPSLCCKFT